MLFLIEEVISSKLGRKPIYPGTNICVVYLFASLHRHLYTGLSLGVFTLLYSDSIYTSTALSYAKPKLQTQTLCQNLRSRLSLGLYPLTLTLFVVHQTIRWKYCAMKLSV